MRVDAYNAFCMPPGRGQIADSARVARAVDVRRNSRSRAGRPRGEPDCSWALNATPNL
jgi:hypothetical protein